MSLTLAVQGRASREDVIISQFYAGTFCSLFTEPGLEITSSWGHPSPTDWPKASEYMTLLLMGL